MWIRILAAAVLTAVAVGFPAHAQIGSMGAGSSAQMFQASQQETPARQETEPARPAAAPPSPPASVPPPGR
jgi:hypothetical protein